MVLSIYSKTNLLTKKTYLLYGSILLSMLKLAEGSCLSQKHTAIPLVHLQNLDNHIM